MKKITKRRLVEPFSMSSYQKNTQVQPPKKLNVYKERNVRKSVFRIMFLRGDIPCHRSFIKYKPEDAEKSKPFLSWKVAAPQDLDYSHYLPIFFDGLCERSMPYNFIARYAIHDLLNAASEKVLPVLPKLINPLKNALNTKNRDIIVSTLRIIQHMCIIDRCIAEALVPYYRRLLPPLGLYLYCKENLSDRIDYNRVGRINEIIEDTLSILEYYGGPDAFINIKYCIPTYCSCVEN